MSRSFLLAFSRSAFARHPSYLKVCYCCILVLFLLATCLLALRVNCCCCCIVVAICYCSLLRWPMLLVVNIIDFAVLARLLPTNRNVRCNHGVLPDAFWRCDGYSEATKQRWSWWLVQMDFQYSTIRSHRGLPPWISSLLRLDTQILRCIIQSSYIHLSSIDIHKSPCQLRPTGAQQQRLACSPFFFLPALVFALLLFLCASNGWGNRWERLP